MIALHNRLPLPEVKARELRAWLLLPGCRLFIEQLAGRAAELTAEAGNLMVEKPDESWEREAKEKADRAHDYVAARHILEDMRNANEFIAAKLEPQPVAAPTDYERNTDRTESFPGSTVPAATAPIT